MGKKNQKHLQPPQPPQVPRRLQFHLIQMVGVPLVMLIPILALLGTFGESVHSAGTSTPQLEMRVEYPTRFRYKMLDALTVSISNASTQPLPVVNVSFDRAYIEAFSTVSFTPAIKFVIEDAYIVEVTDLQPKETRIISVTIQAKKYGRHTGSISANTENAEGPQVQVDTLTFP